MALHEVGSEEGQLRISRLAAFRQRLYIGPGSFHY